MFKKKTSKDISIDSIIGENTKLIGKIQGEGSLRIDGNMEGDIEYKGDVVVAETGKVNGNISCENISLAGAVNGNIKSKNLTLLPTGKLIGDTEISNFVVHENAFFEGNCQMKNEKNNVKDINTKQKISK